MLARQFVAALAGAAFAVATLAYCGGTSPADADAPDAGTTPSQQPTVRSGKRLRARVNTSVDGAREFLGWYDSDLQTACAPAPAMDGKLRCLPLGESQTAYLDAACTSAFLKRNGGACRTDRAFAQERVNGIDSNGCGTEGKRIFRVRLEIPVPTESYRHDRERGCVAEGGTPDPAAKYFALEEVPPSDLVELTEEIE
jgi:hypothetical protein